jgi:hypothetical protein
MQNLSTSVLVLQQTENGTNHWQPSGLNAFAPPSIDVLVDARLAGRTDTVITRTEDRGRQACRLPLQAPSAGRTDTTDRGRQACRLRLKAPDGQTQCEASPPASRLQLQMDRWRSVVISPSQPSASLCRRGQLSSASASSRRPRSADRPSAVSSLQ